MQSKVKLSEGAIGQLASGNADSKPVLQLTDLRLVATTTLNATERYRVMLSDGVHQQQGMLGVQLNGLVHSHKLKKGSIVQLTDFTCNTIQKRLITIIINLNVLIEYCDQIGDPKQYQANIDGEASSVPGFSAPHQPVGASYSTIPSVNGSVPHPKPLGSSYVPPAIESDAGSHPYRSSFSANRESGQYNTSGAPAKYLRTESNPMLSHSILKNHVPPPQVPYQQRPNPMFLNKGPIAKNEAPPRIIPISGLNPYQNRWTIKARVTVKGELRHYNNSKGEGKVFSFDLLDGEGGEIRVTCFNAVVDQFYHQIEAGKVYMISKGSLKPAQKNFNHLHNDHEILLDSTSTIQPCFEDDNSIPKQQFHFRSIGDIEGMDSNSIVDVIGVVSSVSPSTSLMRKNGTETQKRTLQLKDMSGRSVEFTMWGNFCNAEGYTLQSICDSGGYPVLAVKACRVSDFNGKSVGTISSSQLFIDPDSSEAHSLKAWFENNGKNAPSISLSREMGMGCSDVRKTISQIKDEKLGTSEKPDWITVCATPIFIKGENFCYTACPLMIGDRKCHKKVTNNGDGKWRCERCEQDVDECDYRYILQMQIQDYTALTYVTAFAECGEEILGLPAKDLYLLKYEQDEDKYAEIVSSALYKKYIFKLKVKEETYNDEQRVKCTIVKADKVDFISETRNILALIANSSEQDLSSLEKADGLSRAGPINSGYECAFQDSSSVHMSYGGNSSLGHESRTSTNPTGPYGNLAGVSIPAASPSTGMHLNCSSCGGSGHVSTNCPSIMNMQGPSYGGSVDNKVIAPAYGNNNVAPDRYGGYSRQHVGGF
ncbi:DNA metabolism protein [Lithospermum erythrorhizon]|uniref:Replication protein A subunit n=1 Tax=Lithospermum erythrorhizon TaxID=34254 RepID=A0AAV3PLS2_LITER